MLRKFLDDPALRRRFDASGAFLFDGEDERYNYGDVLHARLRLGVPTPPEFAWLLCKKLPAEMEGEELWAAVAMPPSGSVNHAAFLGRGISFKETVAIKMSTEGTVREREAARRLLVVSGYATPTPRPPVAAARVGDYAPPAYRFQYPEGPRPYRPPPEMPDLF